MPAEVLAVVPARYASTRLPGKPLLDRTGKPMIQHVVEAAARSSALSRVVVATDDERIRDAVLAFGGLAVMTRADHPNGTARIAEALDRLDPAPADDAVVVNVQGDEPELEPSLIDALVAALADDPAAPMATLASPFAEGEDPSDPNVVKVALTATTPRRALYFSRSVIPYPRADDAAEPLKHPGLYAYRRSFLPVYAALPPTPLEQAERLEQLRALEHGHAIAVRVAAVRHHGIDTPEQYDAFVRRAAAVDSTA